MAKQKGHSGRLEVVVKRYMLNESRLAISKGKGEAFGFDHLDKIQVVLIDGTTMPVEVKFHSDRYRLLCGDLLKVLPIEVEETLQFFPIGEFGGFTRFLVKKKMGFDELKAKISELEEKLANKQKAKMEAMQRCVAAESALEAFQKSQHDTFGLLLGETLDEVKSLRGEVRGSVHDQQEMLMLRKEIKESERMIVDLKGRLEDAERKRKELHNIVMELKGNIRVFCRVCPLPQDEESSVISYPTLEKSLGQGVDLIKIAREDTPFSLDKVFTPEASQQDVFREISQLIQSALDGYKVCMFAYGQTGSGKTHTMFGRPEISEEAGIIPRALEMIFQTKQCKPEWTLKLEASVMEIYMDNIRDLLRDNDTEIYEIINDDKGSCVVTQRKDDGTRGTLTTVEVKNPCDFYNLLRQVARNRSVGQTRMNDRSSRSHVIFTLQISRVHETTKEEVQGSLIMIDLAGSDRQDTSGVQGVHFHESKAINSSLLHLHMVIFAIAKNEQHVPFRNCKLTRFLESYLGGSAKMLMLVNISSDPASIDETLCSLRFAKTVNDCVLGRPQRQINQAQQTPRVQPKPHMAVGSTLRHQITPQTVPTLPPVTPRQHAHPTPQNSQRIQKRR